MCTPYEMTYIGDIAKYVKKIILEFNQAETSVRSTSHAIQPMDNRSAMRLMCNGLLRFLSLGVIIKENACRNQIECILLHYHLYECTKNSPHLSREVEFAAAASSGVAPSGRSDLLDTRTPQL